MKRYFGWAVFFSILSLAMAYQLLPGALQQSPRTSNSDSTVSYTLQHPLHIVNGVSHQVSSQLVLSEDGKLIKQVDFTIPIRSFDSGNRARDRDMAEVTEAERYPEVIFTSTQITQQNGVLSVSGNLTFHGVTREISFIAQQQWQGEKLVVDGGFDISLDAYNIKRPSIFTMKIKDNMQLNFHMVY